MERDATPFNSSDLNIFVEFLDYPSLRVTSSLSSRGSSEERKILIWWEALSKTPHLPLQREWVMGIPCQSISQDSEVSLPWQCYPQLRCSRNKHLKEECRDEETLSKQDCLFLWIHWAIYGLENLHLPSDPLGRTQAKPSSLGLSFLYLVGNRRVDSSTSPLLFPDLLFFLLVCLHSHLHNFIQLNSFVYYLDMQNVRYGSHQTHMRTEH